MSTAANRHAPARRDHTTEWTRIGEWKEQHTDPSRTVRLAWDARWVA